VIGQSADSEQVSRQSAAVPVVWAWAGSVRACQRCAGVPAACRR